MAITIYGASDDLIEIRGDIEEEFGATEEGDYLAFSDGTLLRVHYTNEGIWRITPTRRGSGELTITQGTNEDDDYTDRATIDASITWVLQGQNLEQVRR